MKRLTILVLAVLVVATGSTYAFDGNRKGFVLGGGLGVAAVCNWKVDVDLYGWDLGEVDESRTGVGVQFVIGGAFDERNVLVYEGNVAGFSSELLADESVAQGFNGAAFYHYWGPKGKSVFTAVGLGAYYFKVGDFDPTNPGGALLLGVGYEFSPHWQVGVYFTGGKSSEKYAGLTGDFEHGNLSILFSGIAF